MTTPFRFELGGVDAYCGAGELARAGELASSLGMKRVLVVTDRGLLAAGHPQRVSALLENAEMEATVFADTVENPSTVEIEAGAALAREREIDGLLAIGGGSALDTARAINFLVSCGGRMEDYWGPELPPHLAGQPFLPSLGIPTTAGTGSEAQRFALISQAETHLKMACGARAARFRRVILDPTLLASAPQAVAALSGIDALSHAVESFVSTAASPFSRLLARDAFVRIERSFEAHLAEPADSGPAFDLLFGAHLAGAAIEASMLGAAHACANPLTAAFGIRHGAAVALLLPHVVRFNAEGLADYADLAQAAGLRGSADLAERVAALRAVAGLPSTLAEAGVGEGDLPALAEGAARQWTARFNPRPVDQEDFLLLYRRALTEAA